MAGRIGVGGEGEGEGRDFAGSPHADQGGFCCTPRAPGVLATASPGGRRTRGWCFIRGSRVCVGAWQAARPAPRLDFSNRRARVFFLGAAAAPRRRRVVRHPPTPTPTTLRRRPCSDPITRPQRPAPNHHLTNGQPPNHHQVAPSPLPNASTLATAAALAKDAAQAAAAATAATPLPPKLAVPLLVPPAKPAPPANASAFKAAVAAGVQAGRRSKEAMAIDAADALFAALRGDKLATLGAAADAGDDLVAFADALPSALGLGRPAAAVAAKAQSASDAVKSLPLTSARDWVAKARAAVTAGVVGGGKRAAVTLDDARGSTDAERVLSQKVDAVNAALDAADAKLAPNASLALKLDAKHVHSIGVVVQLQLNGRFDAGVPTTTTTGRRLQQYTLAQPPLASLTPPRSAAVLESDGWTPWLVRRREGERARERAQ